MRITSNVHLHATDKHTDVGPLSIDTDSSRMTTEVASAQAGQSSGRIATGQADAHRTEPRAHVRHVEAAEHEMLASLGFGKSLSFPEGYPYAGEGKTPAASQALLQKEIDCASRRLGREQTEVNIAITRDIFADSWFDSASVIYVFEHICKLEPEQGIHLRAVIARVLRDTPPRRSFADSWMLGAPLNPIISTNPGPSEQQIQPQRESSEVRVAHALAKMPRVDAQSGLERESMVIRAYQIWQQALAHQNNLDILETPRTTSAVFSQKISPLVGRSSFFVRRTATKQSATYISGRIMGFDSVQGLAFNATEPQMIFGREGIVRALERSEKTRPSTYISSGAVARGIALCNLAPNLIGAMGGCLGHIGLAAVGVVFRARGKDSEALLMHPSAHLRSAGLAAAMLLVSPLEVVLPEASIWALQSHRW